MSDYGFATYDENGKKVEGVVNSKWPIFGPKYNDIKKAYRTIHFTDTKSYSLRTSSSVVVPSVDSYTGEGISQYHGKEKVLIATIPHGYKKRPMGYCTITGSYTKNTRGQWAFTRVKDDWSMFPASTTLNSTRSESGNMKSVVGWRLEEMVGDSALTGFYDNLFNNCGMTYPNDQDGYPMSDWYCGDGYFDIPGDNNSTQTYGQYWPPYTVEWDDTNIKVYRWYYWCDVLKRNAYIESGTTYFDVRGRFKGIIDYAGSSFDLTIYLCPYSFGDLI